MYSLNELSDGPSYFPKTSKLVLDSSRLINNFEQLVPNIAEDFGITQQAALEKSVDFFSNTQVTVQPTEIQGKFYKIMKSAQNFVPMSYTSETVSILKTNGMTGLQIIGKAPLTFVGATYIGTLFFGYCGSVAGNNAIGVVFNSTSFILSRPMRGVEITLNVLILRPISNVIGLPLILNDPRISSNQEVLKLVKKLRGGSWGLVGTAAVLGLIILIFTMGEGFVPNNLNPGWGLDRPNPFQPPTAEQRYPPYYDLLLPRGTSYANRPGGSQILSGVNPQSSREELTRLSTDVVPTQT